MAVSTWPFVKAVRAAWKTAADGSPAVDSVVEGCSACEELRCDGTVGAGGSPDEYGEITLDALVMNGHPTGTFVHLSSVEKPLHVCLDDLEKCYGDKKGQSFSLWLDKVTFVQISSDSWKVKFDKWELAGEEHVGCSTTVLLILKNQMDSCGCMYNRLG